MNLYRVEIEVTLEPGQTAIAVVYVHADGPDGARVTALETMAFRIKALKVEEQP